MSFISELREELASVAVPSDAARRAEIAAAIQMSGGLRGGERGGWDATIMLATEAAARRIAAHIRVLCTDAVPAEVFARRTRRTDLWVLSIISGAELLGRTCGLLGGSGAVRGLPPPLVVLGTAPQAAAVWRAVLLTADSRITCTAKRGPSLVVSCPNAVLALALAGAARRVGVRARTAVLHDHDRVLVSGTDNIAALLNALGIPDAAHRCEQRLLAAADEDAATHPLRTNNHNRTVTAGRRGAAHAQRALDILGESIRPDLREIAELRIADPHATLTEIGARCDPPLNKNTAVGRLRRLLATADRHAHHHSVPDTRTSTGPAENTRYAS